MTNILLILTVAVCVLFSAVFSASEIAGAKSNTHRFEKAAEEGDRIAGLVLDVNKNYVRCLSTILAGNNFVNIAASSAATVLCIAWFGNAGEGIASVAVTVLLLFLGETCPKIIAAGDPDRFMRLFAVPLKAANVILFPIVWAVEKFVNLLAPLWTPKEEAPAVTTEELAEILEDIEDEGVFTEDEGEIIRSAIEFADTAAFEILTPRIDVVAVDIDDFDPANDLDEGLLTYSRVPVYEGTIDNIIGILPTKKLMTALIEKGSDIDVKELLLEPLFVHKTCPVSTLVEEFKKNNLTMAIVADEFGGTMGIVTMEDVLEEIVGDIYDEMDDPEPEIEQTAETRFEVDGGMNIYDMFEEVGYDPDPDFETEYTTVGGWATEILDKFPEAGDEFTWENLHVKVLEAEPLRVETLSIEVLPKKEDEEE